ncbi:TetR family transcriptional regulator C-terminal domain-containing protein [Actinoplanes hulinensis]|uniref:TetR family transcriptional regulator C-terminal domain-containing protein n=1 Tax=Actinoplanes hulinensis TaxID=1144547 RepID=A0ABS7BGM1_9ACTN|nr:TetR family transcriptional regulator C-terminal domain-containing protein [Actinoplanes hulinensis]MBW6439968.1 TetR family transcriptional regulator C-terminal domain-containing protein [Actinoplanes hulinensis]
MPKKVDRQKRRTQIADALMRVAAEQGLEAVSLRHVAAEAGVSAGMVQHYFRTKDEMMTFALDVVRERTQIRVTDAVTHLGSAPSPRDLLQTIIGTLLPLDEVARADGRVALAFLAYTAVRPTASAALREETEQMVGFIAGLLPGPDAENAAAGLLALMEGLGVYLLGGQYTPDQARGILDSHLDRLFAAPPEHTGGIVTARSA